MMDPTRPAGAISTALVAAGAAPGAATDALALAIATAIITEITANANVLPTALIAPAGGGPVTGTGQVQ